MPGKARARGCPARAAASGVCGGGGSGRRGVVERTDRANVNAAMDVRLCCAMKLRRAKAAAGMQCGGRRTMCRRPLTRGQEA
jgi:hypothetical protein